jgi:hypothetical protein
LSSLRSFSDCAILGFLHYLFFVLYHLFTRQTTAQINILYAYSVPRREGRAVVALGLCDYFALRLAAQINRLNTRHVLCLRVII